MVQRLAPNRAKRSAAVAGTKEELAVVSGYLNSLSKLRQRAKETEGLAGEEHEGDIPCWGKTNSFDPRSCLS